MERILGTVVFAVSVQPCCEPCQVRSFKRRLFDFEEIGPVREQPLVSTEMHKTDRVEFQRLPRCKWQPIGTQRVSDLDTGDIPWVGSRRGHELRKVEMFDGGLEVRAIEIRVPYYLNLDADTKSGYSRHEIYDVGQTRLDRFDFYQYDRPSHRVRIDW